MERAGDGDRIGWIRIAVQRYESRLLLYAQRLVGDADRARDVVQETFVRLCRERPADLNGHLAEWLYTVCRSRAMDVRRKESRMQLVEPTVMDARSDESASPFEQLRRWDDVSQILELMNRLPPNQEEAIRLKFQHGLSYREIAAVTGHSASNVGFLIHTGLKSIRQTLAPLPPGHETPDGGRS